MDEVMNDWYPVMSTHFANVNIITDGTSFSISGLWTITVSLACLEVIITLLNVAGTDGKFWLLVSMLFRKKRRN